MRKIATLILLLAVIGLSFGGALAQEVNTTVTDEDGNNITEASPGDEVYVDVVVSTNETVDNPAVAVTVEPQNGLELKPEEAIMWNGNNFIINNVADPFFFLEDGVWIWDIASVWGDMDPGDVTELIVPAIVNTTGVITTSSFFLSVPEEGDPVILGVDPYAFVSAVAPPVANVTQQAEAKKVPMKSTGAPAALAALGVLCILAGSLYSFLRLR